MEWGRPFELAGGRAPVIRERIAVVAGLAGLFRVVAAAGRYGSSASTLDRSKKRKTGLALGRTSLASKRSACSRAFGQTAVRATVAVCRVPVIAVFPGLFYRIAANRIDIRLRA